MDDKELLKNVKTALGLSGDYHDKTMKIYIDDVKEYMRSAGVSDAILNSTRIIGVVCRGVADLWNYGAGDAELSPYFLHRVTQLVLESKEVGE